MREGGGSRNGSGDYPGGLTRSGSNYGLDRRVAPTCFSMRGSSDVLKLLLHWFKERKLS